jgi:5-methylcytosine-specific restriction endonuclease McrA
MHLCRKCGTEMRRRGDGKWRCRPCENAYTRAYTVRHADRVREAKRRQMAQLRADPETRERLNAARRKPHIRANQRQARVRLREQRFFAWRARNWAQRHRVTMPTTALAGLWMKQRGFCALTGERLDRSAVLDHDIPRSRGGSHTIENLQWVTSRANAAKGDMTTTEFAAFCTQVAELIGRRVMEMAA